MNHATRPSRSFRNALLAVTLATGVASHAQQTTLWLDEFDGGASTTGFWIDSTNVTDCRWEYAPDSVSLFDFSQDFAGFWPAGPGFDSSFVFLDSDACGGTAVVVNSYLTSAPFDASALGVYRLHFSHQFRARLASYARVEASPDGITWTQAANYTTTDVGYPNPAVIDSLDISTIVMPSDSAYVRFQFNTGWDWWWALDSISLTFTPSSLGVNATGEEAAVLVYPNPVEGQLNVHNADVAAVRMEVLNAMGQQVLEQGMSRSIAVEGLAPGTYVIVLRDASGASIARTRFLKR